MILIVEHNRELGKLWHGHIARQNAGAILCSGQDEAIAALSNQPISLMVLNLILPGESAFAIADFAAYRRPQAKIIFVTSSTFFSDGSLFQHVKNACMMVPEDIAPEDLGALAQHYSAAS